MSSPLIWIDLEMTGLDPDRCRILEIAALVVRAALSGVSIAARGRESGVACYPSTD